MIDFTEAVETGQKMVAEFAEIYTGPPKHFPEGIRLILEKLDPGPETPQEQQMRIASLLCAFYFAHQMVEKSGASEES